MASRTHRRDQVQLRNFFADRFSFNDIAVTGTVNFKIQPTEKLASKANSMIISKHLLNSAALKPSIGSGLFHFRISDHGEVHLILAFTVGKGNRGIVRPFRVSSRVTEEIRECSHVNTSC